MLTCMENSTNFFSSLSDSDSPSSLKAVTIATQFVICVAFNICMKYMN